VAVGQAGPTLSSEKNVVSKGRYARGQKSYETTPWDPKVKRGKGEEKRTKKKEKGDIRTTREGEEGIKKK